MPRLTEGNREARRAEIVAAARRCFSRDGFHQTLMPDVAAEAGVSTGAPYRYFSSKEEIILEVAGDAFRVLLKPIERLVESDEAVSLADLVTASIDPVGEAQRVDTAGNIVPVDELLRCAVDAWESCCATTVCGQAQHEGSKRFVNRLRRRSLVVKTWARYRMTSTRTEGQES